MKRSKNKKGILLTLVTLVLFILMLGELITYVVITINYDQLSSAGAATLGSSSFLNFISGSAPSFLSTSLSSALNALTVYEGTPSMRQYHFINNTALALSGLMENGTIYGSNSVSSYMDGGTLQDYENVLYAKAASVGSNLSLQNLSISVFQSNPFYLSARLLGSAVLHSSTGTITFPIDQVGNVSLNGTKDLLSVQNGNPISIKAMPNYQFTNLIGNTLAIYGSRSPYMFAYAPIVYSSSGCPSPAPSFSYILAVPTWSGGSPCTNMVGLVTDSASLPPLLPYLIYNSLVSSSANIPSGSSVLLNGAGLSLLGLDGIQKGIQAGYYFGSNFSPSYLQTSESSTTRGSGNGLFSFNLLNRQVAYFNGQATIYATHLPNPSFNYSISVWFNTQTSNGLNCCTDPIYDVYNASANGGIGGGQNYDYAAAFATGQGFSFAQYWPTRQFIDTGPISINTWHNAIVTVHNYENVTIYIDGQPSVSGAMSTNELTVSSYFKSPALAIGSNPPGTLELASPGTKIANLQIYSKALSPSQAASIYINGIDAPPLSNSSLIGWWPLNGNPDDYSGYNNNGTASNIIYITMPGFTEDPIFKTLLNRYHSSVVKGVLNCGNLNQCSNASIPHLYLGSRSLSVDNGNVLNETSGLGLVNGSVPNAAFFNGGLIETPANQIYSGTGTSPFTVGFWMYPEAVGGNNPPLTLTGTSTAVVSDGVSGNFNWMFEYLNSGQFGIASCIESLTGITTCSAPAATTSIPASGLNKWYFVTGVFTGSGKQFQLYINGSKVSTGTANVVGTGDYGMAVGQGLCTSTETCYKGYFDGAVSDLQIYNSILSQSQIQQLYQNNSVNGVNPVGYWPLSQYIYGTLNQTVDEALGNNGIFYNSSGHVCSDSNVLSGTCRAGISPI